MELPPGRSPTLTSPAPTTWRCRWLVQHAGAVHADGAVVADARGVLAIASGGQASRVVHEARGPIVEVDGVLAPGFVVAHGHLELAHLVGRVPGAAGFVPWIGALMGERARAARAELVAAARSAAADLVARGVTTLADIDSLGLVEEALTASPLRVVLYREVLDGARPERAQAALAALDRALAGTLAGRGERLRGLSPHAPHTVSRALLRGLGARRRSLPVQVHWSETPAEVEWLAAGTGPFAPLLGPSPRITGLQALAAAGLLDGASLVHGNHPGAGEPDLVARAGASVVHCPGTHRFFRRAPFPWAQYQRAGVTLALGTDSLASNDRLDPLGELAIARQDLPEVGPGELFEAATRGAARALGLGGRVGEIAIGAPADFVAYALLDGAAPRVPRPAARILDALTAAGVRVEAVWISATLAAGAASD
jgi:cytosine/adenosine deaminase-related metal-dependent hydrolase